MKNYYEILEVDKKASREIIDKAYRTLVKKYHPDLKEHSEKTYAEDRIKEINEAYDILSDKEKREEYNKTLNENFISIEKYNLLIEENINLKNKLNNLENNILRKLNYNSNYTKNINNIHTNKNDAYTNPNSNYTTSKNTYTNYTSDNFANQTNNYNNNIKYEDYSNKSYRKTIFDSLFSLLRSILKLIYKYIFILLILFAFFIFIKKFFFNNTPNLFEFKDLLTVAGVLLLLIYSLK